MNFKAMLKPIKGFRLLAVLLTYALGAGLAQYLESVKSWPVLLGGAAFLILATLTFDYLRALREINDPRFRPAEQTPDEVRQMRLGLSAISATLLTVAATIVVGWMVRGQLWQGVTVLLLAFAAIGVVYALSSPSEKLAPFLPLFETVLVVIIPPALGYFLQLRSMHRFLTMVVLGTVPLYLAYGLLTQLIRFGRDQQKGITTTVTAMGWEAAMVLHNVLILLGYVLFALASLLGFPWLLMWPVFLTLPLGLAEFWLMERVRRGDKPLWGVMKFALGSTILIPVYLLAFAFWIR
jgi:4-hydroxybenzoate polyprenyltransferase